ncbi:MAG TPA: V-type ATP synthase subunit F [Anaerolineales bacterium]|jgi:V/A-type H+-transporting ATPase subunit F|nr:V-type ATP synthase subunit F [Anaerolineales bacterium]
MKMLVIGHQEAVLGFSLVGVHGRAVNSAEEINHALDEALASSDIGIVLVTADVAEWIGAKMDRLRLHSTVPLVVEIPGPQGVPPDQPSLREVVMRAIGVEI